MIWTGILILLIFPVFQPVALSYELVTAYANIIYQDKETLEKFNRRINPGRLRFFMPQTDGSLEGEVKAKIDLITHRVQTVLDMYPENLRYNIYLVEDRRQVQAIYKNLYRTDKDYIAFYSPQLNTVYISPDRMNITVLAHEIGHVVVENFFDISPPERIHELLAQFAERNLGN
ncbi:hypothetical protein LZ24_02576 [Desulfobotulus alkaliphilus]|uniref:Uncharacterized protein n=1 Tax=Desulfobotulus alkaliphilus TaxID=622671 RepID=A0A562RGH7_9BACT|nr:hypothetical protein [Desulfobotulus alkaliphilus]TWI68202.1 hypothetical protein LZ24_02576 [Desulfobotulus alkaliphilus]